MIIEQCARTFGSERDSGRIWGWNLKLLYKSSKNIKMNLQIIYKVEIMQGSV